MEGLTATGLIHWMLVPPIESFAGDDPVNF